MNTIEQTFASSASTADLDVVTVDLYRDVHKGIRNELFALTSRIGNLDPHNVADAVAIGDRTSWFFDLLDAHARHEDELIGPELVVAEPRLDEQVRAEHGRLERYMAEIARLQVAARHGERDGARLATRRWYLAFASFTSAYLAHEATEELDVMPTLNRAMGSSRLAELEGAIVASITPDHFAGYLSLILPATNPGERADLIGGIRASAPPEVFGDVMSLAEGVLATHDFRRLAHDLGPAEA